MMRLFASTTLAVIIGFIIGCALVFGGQGCLSAPQKQSLLTLDCRVRLLEPYLGALTPELIRETIVNGPRELVGVLVELGTDPEEIKRVGDAWKACAPVKPPTAPAAETKPLPTYLPPNTLPRRLVKG